MDFAGGLRPDDGFTAHYPRAAAAPVVLRLPEIGQLIETSGASTIVALAGGGARQLSQDRDPTVASAGQVGSLIKIRVADRWLIANVRSMRLSETGQRR
jgi:hypothetical protein